MMTAPQRGTNTTPDHEPRVRARGHLALLDWDSAASVPAPALEPAHLADPVRRSRTDRLFERGIVLLLVTTIGAVLASLTHL